LIAALTLFYIILLGMCGRVYVSISIIVGSKLLLSFCYSAALK